MELQGFAWNRPKLSTLIITVENESWWSNNYVNSAVRAFGQWNEALTIFATNYTEYSYLSEIESQWKLSNQWIEGYDLCINWTETLSESSDEVGLAITYTNGNGLIVICPIILAVQTNYGICLIGIDMQNIALHELARSLGLSHSNYTDLMYSIYTLCQIAVSVPLDNMANKRFSSTTNTHKLPRTTCFPTKHVSPQTLIDNPITQFFIMVFKVLASPIIASPANSCHHVVCNSSILPSKKKKHV